MLFDQVDFLRSEFVQFEYQAIDLLIRGVNLSLEGGFVGSDLDTFQLLMQM